MLMGCGVAGRVWSEAEHEFFCKTHGTRKPLSAFTPPACDSPDAVMRLRRIRPGGGTRPAKSSPIRERIVRLARLTVALVLGGAGRAVQRAVRDVRRGPEGAQAGLRRARAAVMRLGGLRNAGCLATPQPAALPARRCPRAPPLPLASWLASSRVVS